jgi:type IV secretion system protein VirD4
MTPVEFLARLAAILPAPRLALRRQLGVFSPGSPDRRKIMPAPAPREGCHPKSSAPARVRWADLLRRVWHIDALRGACPPSNKLGGRDRCGGRLRPVALVQDLAEAERYLRARGDFTPLPGPARSRGPPAAAA